jgi:hypothetical protein
MAKPQALFLATLFWLALGAGSQSADDSHSIERIAKTLAELRNRLPVVHYEFERTVFRPKGSMNDSLQGDQFERQRWQKWAKDRHAQNLPFDWEYYDPGFILPGTDITLFMTEESILDLATRKSWSQGKREEYQVKRDANEVPRIEFALEPFEQAFDGIDVYTRNFDGTTEISGQKIRVPVQLQIWRIEERPGESSLLSEWLPRTFCEGGLPAPEQPHSFRQAVSPFLPERWTRGAEEQDSDGYPIIHSLPWLPGTHDQCSLRPDLHYVPCKWQRFTGCSLGAELQIAYSRGSDGLPELQSWTFRRLNGKGELAEMTTVRVAGVSRAPSVDPARFRLEAPDGTLVMEIKTPNDGCYVAGRKTIKSPSLVVVNDKLQLYEVRFQWFNGILAGCSLLVGTVVVLISRRFGRQKSAPQPQGQELPT